MVRTTVIALTFAGLLGGTSASAQTGAYDELRQNAEEFSGTLEQALEIDRSSGLFGLQGERIDSMYLAGHGLVLEVRSNLANARGRLNLAQLQSSVMALRLGDNPFALLQRSAREQSATASEIDEQLQEPLRELLQRVQQIDHSALVESAITQAGGYARILREADGVDAAAYQRLLADIDALREERAIAADRLRELAAAARADADAKAESIEQALGEISAEMELLRERAAELASELRERSESAQAERVERWREDVAARDAKRVEAIGEHGASRRELPADEHVTVILAGLGEESANGGRADLVHNFRKSDLLLCAEAAIAPPELAERSSRYSY